MAGAPIHHGATNPAELDEVAELWSLLEQKDADLRHAAELGESPSLHQDQNIIVHMCIIDRTAVLILRMRWYTVVQVCLWLAGEYAARPRRRYSLIRA